MLWASTNSPEEAKVECPLFRSDLFGRRVLKTVGGTTTVFVSLSIPLREGVVGQEIAEYSLGTAPATPQRKYAFGAYVDEPLVMDVAGTKYYYHQKSVSSVMGPILESGPISIFS